MLFVLVMDVLKLLVNRADTNGVLRPLAAYRLKYQVYADDMVLFLQYGFDLHYGIATSLGLASGLKIYIYIYIYI